MGAGVRRLPGRAACPANAAGPSEPRRTPRDGSYDGLCVAGARMAASDFGHRPGDQCLEDLDVEVRQALDVQADLGHPVFPEPGQELDLPGALHAEVDDRFPAADREADEA